MTRSCLLALAVAAAAGAFPRPSLASDPADLAAVRRLLEAEEAADRASAVRRLAGRTDEAAYRLVVATLVDRHPYVRRAAAGVLGIAIEPALRARLLRDVPGWRETTARAEACRAFAQWADAEGRTGLLRLLADGDESVRAEAARCLGDDPDPAAEAALLRATSDRSGLVRATAIDGLAPRPRVPGGPRLDVVMEQGLRDGDWRVRLSALEGSVAAGGEAAVSAVSRGLTDAVWSVRLVAAESAGALRSKTVLAPLVAALSDPRERVAAAAGASLVEVTGIPFDPDPGRWKAWLSTEGAAFDPATVERRGPRQPSPVYASGGAPVRFLDSPILSTHVAFVIDASGSMAALLPQGGTRWDEVRKEIDRVLEAMGTAAEGNVVLFGDEAEALFPKATRFSPATRGHVRERLSDRAPSGRTALFDGIALALDDPAVDTLVVLSDGVPSAGGFFTRSDLRAELRRANRWRRARIDVVSIAADGSPSAGAASSPTSPPTTAARWCLDDRSAGPEPRARRWYPALGRARPLLHGDLRAPT
jgi:HEAT repeat protein